MYNKEPFHNSFMFHKTKDGEVSADHPGASLHDWYVGMALIAIIGYRGADVGDMGHQLKNSVFSARAYADEIMARRGQAKD